MKTAPAEITIAAVVRECLQEAGQDVQAATDLMIQRVHNDGNLRLQITDPLVASACYEAVAGEIRSERVKVWTAPNYTRDGNGNGLRAAMSYLLLDFRLPGPGFKPLRHASRDEIEEGAAHYERTANDASWKARWLRLCAARMKGSRPLGKILGESELRDLQEIAKQ